MAEGVGIPLAPLETSSFFESDRSAENDMLVWQTSSNNQDVRDLDQSIRQVSEASITLSLRERAKAKETETVPWTPFTVFCWFLLGIIHGTTATMVALAGEDINPAVIVVLQSPGAMALFVVVMLIWSACSKDMKAGMKETLSKSSTYRKVIILGVIRSGGPFLLFTYGLVYVPASFGGAFLALIPVWTVVWDQTLFRALGYPTGRLNGLQIAGMVVTLIGVGVYMVPSLAYKYSDDGSAECQLAANDTNVTLSIVERRRLCASDSQVAINVVELLFGSILSGFAGVYWRIAKGNINFTLSGSGETIVGGILAVLVLLIFHGVDIDIKFTAVSISALVYLTIFSGFVAGTLPIFLSGKIGTVPAALVMCFVPVVSWVEDRLVYMSRGSHGLGVEAVGLIALIAGLILFEGRVDQVCGMDVPCVKYLQRVRDLTLFRNSLRGDTELRMRGMSQKLLDDEEFEAVHVSLPDDTSSMYNVPLGQYVSDVGEFVTVR